MVTANKALLDVLPNRHLRSVRAYFTERAVLSHVASVLLLLAVFVTFELTVDRLTRLSDAAYFQPVLLLEFGRNAGWPLLIAAAAVVLLLVVYGGLLRRWSSFDHGRQLRNFCLLLAVAIAWPLTTYGYNYYFDQAHLIDRGLLVVLLVALYWRPLFILPFTMSAFILLWQLGVPQIGGTIFAHKLQVLHVLNLFAAFLLTRCIVGGSKSVEFVFLSACLVASSYWLPALGKFQIDWLQHVNLHLVPAAAYAHGWLSSLGGDEVAQLAGRLQPINWPLALFTIAFEAGFLLFFLRRRLSLLLLCAAIVFHAGVFLFFGFLFWTWIVVDVALLLLLLQLRPADLKAAYSPPLIVLSIILIAAGGYWAHPPRLGWHDTRLTYTFHVAAIDVNGAQWPLRASFFEPYGDSFTMGAFSYVVDEHSMLVSSYGVTRDGDLADRINAARSAEEIFAIEADADMGRYDSGRANTLFDFIARYVANRRQRGSALPWLRPLAPPPQFWGYRQESVDELQDIETLIVIERTTFFDGNTVRAIRETEVARFAPALPAKTR